MIWRAQRREAGVVVGRVAVLTAILMAPATLVAQLPKLESLGDEEITIDAESISYDQREDTVSASGQVVIRRGDTVLHADAVRLNRQTSEAEAIGAASLSSAGGVIRAERMSLNLEEETGVLLDAEIQSQRLGYFLWGDRIEKGLGQNYHIENGRFTTCRCAKGAPSWSISGESLDVALDGYGILQAGTFNILDVPVLYVPRVAFPVHRERQPGLLFPRVGFSNRRGLQVLQPLYWPISKSHDATLGFDIETSARLGLLGEYRYAASPTFHGDISVAYFNEAIRGAATESSTGRIAEPNVPEDRWGLVTEHTQQVGGAEGYMDLMLTGDDLFLREINTFTIDHEQEVALRTLPFTTSRIGFLQRWNRAALQGDGIFYQDLIGRDSLALQRAPEVRLTGQKRVALNLLGEMKASVTNFQRENGIAGIRGDLRPGVQLRLPLGKSLFGSVRAAFRESAYQLTEDEMSDGFRGDDPTAEEIRLPQTSTREIVELGADLSTGFSRIFDFPHLGVDKLKHTIEPQFQYLYVPTVSQDELPIFDGVDRVNERSLVTYGIASRLLARSASDGDEPGQVHEITRFSIAQSYDVTRAIPTIGGTGTADHFSDIDLALRVNTSRMASVRLRSTYDTSDTDLSSASIVVRLQEPERFVADEEEQPRLTMRSSVSVAYRFITDNVLEQVGASTVIRVTDRIGFLYATRYDVPKERFLENHVGVRLISACDCWSLDLGFTDKSNPNELEVRAQITLVGLGAVGNRNRFDLGY